MGTLNTEWEQFDDYAKKVLISPQIEQGINFLVQQVSMRPKTRAKEHSHENQTEIFIGLKNSGYFLIDGEKKKITEGESLRVEPKVKHTVGNDGDQDFEFLAIKLDYEK